MAKKRRGRPPGSGNKRSIAKLGSSVASMDVGQLRDYIGSLESALAKKFSSRKTLSKASSPSYKVTFPRRQRVLFAP